MYKVSQSQRSRAAASLRSAVQAEPKFRPQNNHTQIVRTSRSILISPASRTKWSPQEAPQPGNNSSAYVEVLGEMDLCTG